MSASASATCALYEAALAVATGSLALLETRRDLETRRMEVERGVRELRDLASQAEAAKAGSPKQRSEKLRSTPSLQERRGAVARAPLVVSVSVDVLSRSPVTSLQRSALS